MQDAAVLDFLVAKGKSAKWITSVCTGSLVLGADGLLKDKVMSLTTFVDALAAVIVLSWSQQGYRIVATQLAR